MSNGPSQSQIETIIGNTISYDRERLKAVEIRGENAATQVDIERLEGKINLKHQEMITHVSEVVSKVGKEVSELETSTLNQILRSFIAIVAIASPIVTGILIALLNYFLNKSG